MSDLYVRKITLDKIPIQVKTRVPWNTLAHMKDIDCLRDLATRDLLYRLNAYLAGTPTNPQVVEHPSSWWEMLKQERFPNWFVTRWPVKMVRVTVQRWLVCPHTVMDSDRKHIAFLGSAWSDERSEHERRVR